MIDFQDISISFGTQEVLKNVFFRVNAGEHVGITGPNGAGKSTIFKLLTGELTADEGNIVIPGNTRIGHLHQQLNAHSTNETLVGYAENAVGDLNRIETEIHALESLLASGEAVAADPETLERLGDLQTEFEHLGGYEMRSRAEATLSGLGFSVTDFDRPFAEFSGGWQMRAELARVLTGSPDILLLDEPTNYLDVGAVEWLRGYLRDFDGILMLISHDRFLLNSLTSVTLEVANSMAERYAGNYNHYVVSREARREQLLAARRNQEHRREQIERFVERFRAQANKASQVQSRLKMLEKMEEIRIPGEAMRAPRIKLPKPKRSGVEVACLEAAGVSYDGESWVFRNVDFRLERGMKAAVVGSNGMGKTTLLRVLADKLPLREGKRKIGVNVEFGYQAQDFAENMNPQQNVFAVACKDTGDAPAALIRNVLGGVGFAGDSIDKPVEVLSGGEKVRLALVRLLLRDPNFILLDEPTTHLDIPARQALEQALRDYAGTLCFVSHDIEFIRNVADTIYEIGPGGIKKYFGGYDYYRRKLTEIEMQENRSPKPGGSTGSQPASVKLAGSRKQQRQQTAKQTRELAKRQKSLARNARQAEEKIEKLHAEQAQLLAEFRAPIAGTDMADTNRRLSEIQEEIETATAAWEDAELALEKLRQ